MKNTMRVVLRVLSYFILSFLLLCLLVSITNGMVLVSIIFLIPLIFFIYISVKVLSIENMKSIENKLATRKRERAKNKKETIREINEILENSTNINTDKIFSEEQSKHIVENKKIKEDDSLKINSEEMSIKSDEVLKNAEESITPKTIEVIEQKIEDKSFDFEQLKKDLKSFEEKDKHLSEELKEVDKLLEKNKPNTTSSPKIRALAKFSVAGVTQDGRQKLLKQLVVDEKEYLDSNDLYGGYSNSEIRNYGGNYYEVDISGTEFELSLIPEPENEYDPNAIKVVHKDIGKIGYVPKERTKSILNILDKNNYRIEWWLRGGKRKYYDDYDDKVRTETLSYGVLIRLYKKE